MQYRCRLSLGSGSRQGFFHVLEIRANPLLRECVSRGHDDLRQVLAAHFVETGAQRYIAQIVAMFGSVDEVQPDQAFIHLNDPDAQCVAGSVGSQDLVLVPPRDRAHGQPPSGRAKPLAQQRVQVAGVGEVHC